MPDELLDDILKEGEKQGIKPKDDAERQQALATLRPQLKALIARDLWEMSEYYVIMNEHSDIVQEAIKLLE